MMTVIIMIAMLMSFVPTMMTTMEGGMFEEVMTVITVANKVFTNKVFNILIKDNNNQQSSKDVFTNEDEVEEVEDEVSCFDSLSLLLNNNNEPPPMTTRPLWWWFTKDVLRRTTKGRTQLEKDNNEDKEGAKAEAERRNTNREIKVRVRGGSLVEERSREEPMQEKLSPKARSPKYTRFTSSLCVL